MPLVIAHRGASAYETENSLAAFRRAIEMGSDGVELDVHVTADGEPVVHHDPAIQGLRISENTLETLARHTLPNGETVPTLAKALDTLGPEQFAFVEVKDLPPGHDERLLAVLAGAPGPDHCQVHSFDHRIVQRLHKSNPSLRCGLLSCSYALRPFLPLLDVGAHVLWQRQDMVDRELVTDGRGLGLRVFAWTVDDPDRMRALIEMGVDGICTNRPDVARKIVGRASAST